MELSRRGPVDIPTPPSSCTVDPTNLTAPGCELINSDTAAIASPETLWGRIDCETSSRHQVVAGGADPHPTATGAAQPDDSFRRLTVFDGDDYYGERCELGRNENRYGSADAGGTFMLYREGERKITFISARMGDSLLSTSLWRTVVQMKQAQPSANGGGVPILAIGLRDGRLTLDGAEAGTLYSAAVTDGVWTRMALDVTYSQNPSVGSITMYVDTNGDGDAADPGEQSPLFHLDTLKPETSGGSAADGIAPGASIPSHLRVGVYHDTAIECPNGCPIDLDNIQVLG